MMALKKTALYISLLMGTMTATAQNVDETFNMQGEYDITLTKQERIAQLPSSLDLKVTHPGLQYSPVGVSVPVSPYITPLAALGWKDKYDYDNTRGYVALGMGSYLDIVGSAGYRIIDNSKTQLGVRLQHYSTSAYNPYKDDERDPKPAKRKVMDEYIGVYGSHLFDGAGRLDASLNYRLGYFNYYSALQPETPFMQPSQTTNTLDFAARFTSDASHSLLWNAGIEYNYFGYRRMYLDNGDAIPGLKQSLLSINGGVTYPLSSASALRHSVGMDLRADLVMFNSQTLSPQPVDNYSRYRLAPKYSFDNGAFSGRLGATIDLMANAGPADGRYSVFHIAPDIYAGYRAGRFGIGAQLGGGVELNTLQRNANLDRYTTPWLDATTPIYSPLDGRVALDFGSFGGFSAGVAFAYKVTNNQPLVGRYLQYLTGTLGTQPHAISIHGYSLQASLGYSGNKYFNISGSVAFQPQSGETGYFNGADRPRWIIDTSLGITPIDRLSLSVSFGYRGVRKLYGVDNHSQEGTDITYLRLPDITNLGAGVSYELLPNKLTLWINADNLLNTDDFLNPLVPTSGISIMGGAAVKF